MKTNAQQFAERGDAWDARVRLDVGLWNEPSLLSNDWFEWEDAPPPYVRPPAPVEKPDPALVRASADARRNFNRLRAIPKVRL